MSRTPLWQAIDYVDAARFCNASGAYETTIDACRIGLSLDPRNAMLHVYRGCAYDELGRLDEAVADCEAAIALAPGSHTAVLALITLALVRERLGDPRGALDAAHRAIAIEPHEREAHAVLGTLLAWHGDYPAAWPELECHWLDERLRFRARFPDLTEWNGEEIAGRRVLIVHGQGLGDMLQMLRYVPRLRERGAQVLLECAPVMEPLVRGTAGLDAVYAPGAAPRDAFDAYARMMTLGRLCGEDARGPATDAYLTANPDAVGRWLPRVRAPGEALRAGLVWAGNPNHPNDRRRSLALAQLAPLVALPGVRWFSLQVGPRANDPAPFALTRLANDIHDMSDTAAIVAQLDLVIAADTAVAHLAGALGTPVWTLLPWRPDWRWSRSSDVTPWYASMRLFHAASPAWSEAIDGAVAALRALTARSQA